MPERIIRIVDSVPCIESNAWRFVRDAQHWDELRPAAAAARRAPAEGLLLPLEAALAHAGDRPQDDSGALGVWLGPADDPERVAPLLARARIVGVHFPKFTDGRGYSTAVLLRTRLGWRGELRALGDVLQDQLFALRRVGFDSFALREDRDPVAALRGFSSFSGTYQGSVDQPLPAYRRAGVAA
jgi:uncharacterized protein (DUF934 family)